MVKKFAVFERIVSNNDIIQLSHAVILHFDYYCNTNY